MAVTDPFVLRCQRDFAEAHGISELEASAYFADFGIDKFIKRNRAGLGHYQKDTVLILHNVITMKGGQLPEMIC